MYTIEYLFQRPLVDGMIGISEKNLSCRPLFDEFSKIFVRDDDDNKIEQIISDERRMLENRKFRKSRMKYALL